MSGLNSDDLHRIFNKLDKDGDGRVSFDELGQHLGRIGLYACIDDLQTMVGKPSLDFVDFVLFYEHIVKGEFGGGGARASTAAEEEDEDEELEKTFEVFDMNGDGFITCEELQCVLSRLGFWDGSRRREAECRKMINVYDANSDGRLDFVEFKKMMLLASS